MMYGTRRKIQNSRGAEDSTDYTTFCSILLTGVHWFSLYRELHCDEQTIKLSQSYYYGKVKHRYKALTEI